jgi:hypothetical protein
LVLSRELRVSKLIILSKQSSSPSLRSTLIACLVSALVKSWKRETDNTYHTHAYYKKRLALNHLLLSLLRNNNATYHFPKRKSLQNALEKNPNIVIISPTNKNRADVA